MAKGNISIEKDSFKTIAYIELKKKSYYGYIEVIRQAFLCDDTGEVLFLYVMIKDNEIYGTTCNIETAYYWMSQTLGAYYKNDNINI